MLQIERELTTRYSNIHNKFFPKPEKPKPEKPRRAIPGNNAVLISWLNLVPVLNWDIGTEAEKEPDLEIRLPRDTSIGFHTVYPTVDQIITIVNLTYGYTKAELGGDLRKARITRCRQIISYLILRHTLVSSMLAGRLLKRDHTTILYGRDKVARARRTDPVLDKEVTGYELELSRLTG